MAYKRVLTIQDVSCFGQCSGTVALPIISACGHECAIIPSAVLSTHTGGFTGFTFNDLSSDIPKIREHWQKEDIKFDCIYTGYLGSVEQIKYVADIFDSLLKPGGIKVVDPAMADNGKLYTGFDELYVEGMKHLCARADIILPNITEACLMTGMDYREEYDQKYIGDLLNKLDEMGAPCVILTGVSYRPESTGVVIYEDGYMNYYEHVKVAKSCHGTGDVYSSAFVGAMMEDKGAIQAAVIAADYTVDCLLGTEDDDSHWYGVKFEPALPELLKSLGKIPQ